MANDAPDWTSVSAAPEAPIAGSPFTIARDGATHTIANVPIPAGVQWLALLILTPGDISGLTIIGATTGVDYAQNIFPLLTSKTYIKVHPSADAVVTIRIGMFLGSGSATVAIVYGYSPAVATLDSTFPAPFFLLNNVNEAISTPLNSASQPDMGVQIENVNPPLSFRTTVNGAIGVGNIAAGGTFTLFAGGGALLHTYLKRVQFKVVGVANSFGTIECPSGTVRANWNGALTDTYDFDWDFLDCGANAAAIIRNSSAVNSGSINGHGTANQS